ncbi:MAG: dephospho-CoA kinase [Methylophaga sp.]
MVFKVGLTGGVASGKSTVSDLFRDQGVMIIDADVIARDLLNKDSPCYQQVVRFFGSEVLLENGEINRAWLRDRIFSDSKAKQVLESIIHPRVRQEMLAAADNCHQAYCILSIPLLVEAQMQSLVDRIAVVDVEETTQLTRLMARDGLSQVQAIRMLENQCRRAERLAAADDIIDNSQAKASLLPQIKALHKQYLKLAEKP